MDDRKYSISSDALYARLGSEAAPIIVDVRRDADCADASTLVADAFQCSPDGVEQWQTDLPSGRQVVTYCVHGQQVSQGVAAALRFMGVEASPWKVALPIGLSRDCRHAATSALLRANG